MVRLLLSIKASLENVTNLVPTDNFIYRFTVKCNSCNETHPKHVELNRFDQYDVSGSRGKAHFVWRCGMCKRESSAKFDESPPRPYKEENERFGPLVVIECRGLEFTGFDPSGSWKCDGLTGKTFDVDLEGGEWFDYDDKAALPVGVSDVGSEWTRAQ